MSLLLSLPHPPGKLIPCYYQLRTTEELTAFTPHVFAMHACAWCLGWWVLFCAVQQGQWKKKLVAWLNDWKVAVIDKVSLFYSNKKKSGRMTPGKTSITYTTVQAVAFINPVPYSGGRTCLVRGWKLTWPCFPLLVYLNRRILTNESPGHTRKSAVTTS